MICPQCEAASEVSRVFPGENSVTLLAVAQYWDEAGNFVEDDPNTHTKTFSCSNGHNWRTLTVRGLTTVENLANA